MSTEYHKISTPFKRHFDGPNKGKLIMGDWAVPELDYLSSNYWEFTEKVDGTNIRIQIGYVPGDGDPLVAITHKGRTDNANIPNHLSAYLEKIFPTKPSWSLTREDREIISRLQEIRQWLWDNDLTTVTLYGEGYGPKIQKGGGNYRSDASFVLFDVKIGDFWLDRENVNDVASKLGIDSVPVIGKGTLWDAIRWVKEGPSLPEAMKYDTKAGDWWKKDGFGLRSTWGDFEAEGIVARPLVPLFTRQGNRIITKIKGVDFR